MTPWTVVYQAPPSMGFSRQEHWSGLPFSSAGDLPDPGIEPGRCLRSAGKENKTRPPNYKWGSRAWKDTCDGVRTTGRGGDRFSLTPVGKGGIRGLGVVLLASICRWGNWGQARQPLATIARLGWWEEGSNNPGRVPGGDQGSLRTWEARGGKTWGGGGQWGDSLLEGKWTAPLRLKGRDGRRTCTRERTGCTGRGAARRGHVLRPGHHFSRFQDAGRINEWNVTSLLQVTGMGLGEARWRPHRHTFLSILVERRRSQKRTRHNRSPVLGGQCPLSEDRQPLQCSDMCPTDFRTSSKFPPASGGSEASTESLKEELMRLTQPAPVSSEKQNQTAEFCLANPQPTQWQLRVCFQSSLPFLGRRPQRPPPNQTQFWPVATGFQILKWVFCKIFSFKPLVRLLTSCPNFLGEWDLFKRGIKSPCSGHWVKTRSIPGNFKD